MKKICNLIYYSGFALILLFLNVFIWMGNIDSNNTTLWYVYGAVFMIGGIFFLCSPFVVEGVDVASTRHALFHIIVGIMYCYNAHNLFIELVSGETISYYDYNHIIASTFQILSLVVIIFNIRDIFMLIREKYFEFWLSFLAAILTIVVFVLDMINIDRMLVNAGYTLITLVLIISFVLSLKLDRTTGEDEYINKKRSHLKKY